MDSYCKQESIHEDVMISVFQELYANSDKSRQDSHITSGITPYPINRIRLQGDNRQRERQYSVNYNVSFIINILYISGVAF